MSSPSFSVRAFNSWDLLKIIALLFMFVDHAGAYFFIHQIWIRSLGRGAAPIFLFLAGYASSYRFNREVFALACLMWVANILNGDYLQSLNILFTILICRGIFRWMEKRGKMIEKPLEWFILLALLAVPSCFLSQYGTLGMMFAACGYMQRRPERYSVKTVRQFMVGTFLIYIGTFTLFFDLSYANVALMLPVVATDYWLMSRFSVHAIDMHKYPAWLTNTLAVCAHYSGRIYAGHLLVIAAITHYPI